MKNGTLLQSADTLYDKVSTWPDDRDFPIQAESTLEEYLEIVKDGPNKGKSALWFMAFSEEKPCPLEEFFKKFESITPTHVQINQFKAAMLSQAQQGKYSESSTFSILSKYGPWEFTMKMFDFLKAELTIDQLVYSDWRNEIYFLKALLMKEPERGEIVFVEGLKKYFYQNNMRISCELISLLRKLPEQSNLRDAVRILYGSNVEFLRSFIQYRRNELNISWLVKVLAEKDGVLSDVMKVNEVVKPMDLVFDIFNLLDENIFAVENLVDVFVNQPGVLPNLMTRLPLITQKSMVNRIMEKHDGADLTLDDVANRNLLAILYLSNVLKIWEKYLKDKKYDWYFDNNVLFVLAIITYGYSSSNFLLQEITSAQWLKRIENGNEYDKGKSLLWYFVHYNLRPEQFKAIWDRVKEHITWEDVAQPADGISILRMLAIHCERGLEESEAYIMVYKHFAAKIITLKDLGEQPEGEVSTFHALVSSVKNNAKNSINFKLLAVIKRMLKHSAGVIDDLDIDGVELNQLFREYLPTIYERGLIRARDELFRVIRRNDSDVRIEKEANEAMEAGYLSAFYDVAQFYFAGKRMEEGYESLEKVPAKSIHYQRIVNILANHYFSKKLFEKALLYALQIGEENVRIALVQQIACHYSCDNIPAVFRSAIHAQTTVDGCIKLFDEIASNQLLQENYRALTAAFEKMRLGEDKVGEVAASSKLKLSS